MAWLDQVLRLTLTLNAETYAIEGYNWRQEYERKAGCDVYEEIAHIVEYGIELEIPVEVESIAVPKLPPWHESYWTAVSK